MLAEVLSEVTRWGVAWEVFWKAGRGVAGTSRALPHVRTISNCRGHLVIMWSGCEGKRGSGQGLWAAMAHGRRQMGKETEIREAPQGRERDRRDRDERARQPE